MIAYVCRIHSKNTMTKRKELEGPERNLKPSTNTEKMTIRFRQQICKSVDIKGKKRKGPKKLSTLWLILSKLLLHCCTLKWTFDLNLLPSDTKKWKKGILNRKERQKRKEKEIVVINQIPRVLLDTCALPHRCFKSDFSHLCLCFL